MTRLCAGTIVLLLSSAACTSTGTKPAAPVGASAAGAPGASSAVYSSPVPTSSDQQVASEWCGSVIVRAELPGGATATFRPAQADRFSIRVGQTFELTATSRCGMAFLADGVHVDYAPGSSEQMPFAGAPGLPSGVVLASPTTSPNPPETVNASYTALMPGTSTVAVEVDVPSERGGYLQPVAITVSVTP